MGGGLVRVLRSRNGMVVLSMVGVGGRRRCMTMVVVSDGGRRGMIVLFMVGMSGRGRRGMVFGSVIVVGGGLAAGSGMTVVVLPMAGVGGGMAMIFRAGGGRRSSVTRVVVAMIRLDRGMVLVVVACGRGRRMCGVVIRTVARMTLSGVGAVTRARAVIVVRLLLVAHCYSVPQPLSAVFAAKSV